ncbi:phage major capsid protein [Methyloligella sp. 2.7D]|uniref:phage major capsid protein n=1 Tax=unclassified Methyloligella TaxID=2625955 RepID=UPI00157BBE88|nr:phage major capsid protein [Methyloligella sp. GL2]QKP78449.1 phage major capsid protein [Methyloligella sp. GL2]
MNATPRGLVGRVYAQGPDAAAILTDIQTSVEDWKKKQGSRVDELESAIDENARALAAFKIGGVGSGDDDTPAARRQAVANLGVFGRTGRPDALTEGFEVRAAMRSDSNPDGGYLVPEELSKEIIRHQRDDSAMRRLARVITTSSASFKQPVSQGGLASGWVGETEARPETAGVSLRMLEIFAGEVYAMPVVTQNLLDDSAYNLGEFLTTEITDAFNEQEGGAFIHGDGINKPRGFLTYDAAPAADATRDADKLQYVPTGVAASLSDETHNGADTLIDLVFSLKAKYRSNGAWLMNSASAAKIAKLKDAEDRYLWQPALSKGLPPMLLGYPVEFDEDMPDIEANAMPVAFGDFQRGYMITDRSGVRILRDPLTAKPYVKFYATKRVGGAVIDHHAVKLLKVASS